MVLSEAAKGKYILVQERNKKNPKKLRMQSLNPLINSIHSHRDMKPDSMQRLKLPTADGISEDYTETYQAGIGSTVKRVVIPSSYKQTPHAFTPIIIYNEVPTNETIPEPLDNKWIDNMVFCIRRQQVCKPLPFVRHWSLKPPRETKWHVEDIIVDDIVADKKQTAAYLEDVMVTGQETNQQEEYYPEDHITTNKEIAKQETYRENIATQKQARKRKIRDTKLTIKYNYINSFKSPEYISHQTKSESQHKFHIDKSATNTTTNTLIHTASNNKTDTPTAPIPTTNNFTDTNHTGSLSIYNEGSAASWSKPSDYISTLYSSLIIYLGVVAIVAAVGYALRGRNMSRSQHNIRTQNTQQQSGVTTEHSDHNTQNSNNGTTIEEAEHEPLTTGHQTANTR